MPLSIAPAFVLPLLLAFMLTGCGRTEAPESNPAHSDTHDLGERHSSHEAHSTAVTPPAGERWPTDEPLRAAMTRLQAAVNEALRAHERGTLDATHAQALAQSVEKEVAFMIENCKLPPQADAALHVLIGRMLSAVARLKETPADENALPELAHVLQQYSETFDHPNWTP